MRGRVNAWLSLRRFGLLAAIATLLITVSCGGGGGDAPANPTSTRVPATATRAKPTPTTAASEAEPTRATGSLPDPGDILDDLPVGFPKLTEEEEIKIGKECRKELEEQYGKGTDQAAIEKVKAMGDKLVPQSERPGLKYDFTVLASDEVNAIAYPGGYIHVLQGMLDWVESDDELAFILGHEIGHVALKHGAKKIEALTPLIVAEQTAKGLPIPVEQVYRLSRADIAARFVAEITLRGWGRSNELDADEAGVQYSAKSGYRAGAALESIDRLGEGEEPGTILDPLLATHPPSKDRRERVEETIRRENLGS